MTAWRQLYYDDAASLRLRYDLVNRTDLRGAGIWALGYDGLAAGASHRRSPTSSSPTGRRRVVGISTLAAAAARRGVPRGAGRRATTARSGYDVQRSVDGGPWGVVADGHHAVQLASTSGRTGTGTPSASGPRTSTGTSRAWKSLPLGSLGAPASLRVGGFATVLIDGLRMRTSPTTGASVMATLADGAALHVIGGPTNGDGYTWYQVTGPGAAVGARAAHARRWLGRRVRQRRARTSRRGARSTPRRSPRASPVSGSPTAGCGVLTPNGDGSQDTLVDHAGRTGARSTRLSLRVFRLRRHGSSGPCRSGPGRRAPAPSRIAGTGGSAARRSGPARTSSSCGASPAAESWTRAVGQPRQRDPDPALGRDRGPRGADGRRRASRGPPPRRAGGRSPGG